MNAIFLDIDGVVNTLEIYDEAQPFFKENSRSLIDRDGYYYDMCDHSDKRVSNRSAVLWLNLICKENNAKLVLSSSWRVGGHYEEVIECLRNTGLNKDIEFIGQTPVLWGKIRGKEIEAFLKVHPEITDYVILDDDSDMGRLKKHLVQTDVNGGINATTRIKVSDKFNKIKKRKYYG